MESKEKVIAEMFYDFYDQKLKPAISIEDTAVIGEFIQMAHAVVGHADLNRLNFGSEFTSLLLQPSQED
jgi:hypothetical protein